MTAPFEIDPAWPVVRDVAGDELLEDGLDDCEICNARVAEFFVDRGGVETPVCGYCR